MSQKWPLSTLIQATPSANGMLVSLLARLHLATWENLYRDRCNALIQAFSGEAMRAYISMGSYLAELEVVLTGLQIVIVGPLTNPKPLDLVSAVMGRSLPNRTLVVVDPLQSLGEGHPAFGKKRENGQPTAYVSHPRAASAPIPNPVPLSQLLQLPP